MTAFSSITRDARTLSQLIRPRKTKGSHQEQLEVFYRNQADGYDDFRDRLLQGRQALLRSIVTADFSGVWIDIGGGTGRSIEFVADRITPRARVIVLDLCEPLLDQARMRIQRRGWLFAEALHADITHYSGLEQQADIVTFSYSLSMIPNWRVAIERAAALLKPNGVIGVVDFTCFERNGSIRERLTGSLWRHWFAYDGVHLSADHHALLRSKFYEDYLVFGKARIPYLCGARAPYYTFIGRAPRSSYNWSA